MMNTTSSSDETQALAERLFQEHSAVSLWLLEGDLGVGKTTFVQGYARARGVEPERVKSPTFALLNVYEGWIHVDAYRLDEEDAFLVEQIQEYLERGFAVLVEWPERLPSLLKQAPALHLRFTHEREELRTIEWNLLL